MPGGPDPYDVWARQVSKQKKGLSRVSLKNAITRIDVLDTIEGSSAITLSLADPHFKLIDSGFFDADKDGKLDPIDVNYPIDSRFWWRLSSMDLDIDGSPTVTMRFMERAAVHLMQRHGPVKISRAKKTRAQFIKLLASKIKAGGGIDFHSHELNVKQRQKKPDSESDRKKKKQGGISRDEDLTIKQHDGSDHKLTVGELHNAQAVLDEAFEHTDDNRTLLALLMACIVEAPMFANPKTGDSSSVGILQLLDIHFGGSVSKRRDIDLVVKTFLLDGFSGKGGAIQLAKDHPDWSVGKIAQTVQGSAHPDRYDKVRQGAEDVLAVYGGGSRSASYRKSFHFEVDPKETFWDAMRRLANDVNWALFFDGQDLYYDDERTLTRQKPAAVIKRGDKSVLRISGTWDQRKVATECSLSLTCDPFKFRAGEVLKLKGFGPLSSGSVPLVKKPGCWLIEEIRTTIGQPSVEFKLKQPEREKWEPAPDLGERKEDTDSGRVIEGSPKYVIDHVVLPIANDCGIDRTVEQNDAGNAPRAGIGTSDHGGPPSVKWAADMSNGSRPSPEMDELADRLADRFGIPWSGSGGPKHVYKHNGWEYRVQLIYRTSASSPYGDHTDHVHFGILLGKEGSRKATQEPQKDRWTGGDRTPHRRPR